MTKMTKALIVVDVQNDFCHSGKLAVKDGDAVVPVINAMMDDFDIVILTQDWHPEDHCSFEKWPVHCVQGKYGADFNYMLDTEKADLIIRKGKKKDVDSYSAFLDEAGMDLGLEGYLDNRAVTDVTIVGLATDYCVFETAMHAQEFQFDVTVDLRACRGVSEPTTAKAIFEMEEAGIRILK